MNHYKTIEEVTERWHMYDDHDTFWMPVRMYRNDNGAITATGHYDIVKCVMEKVGDHRYHVVPIEEGWEYSDFLTLESKLVDDFNSGFAIKSFTGDKVEHNVTVLRDVGGIYEEFLCDRVYNCGTRLLIAH